MISHILILFEYTCTVYINDEFKHEQIYVLQKFNLIRDHVL